MLAAQASGHFAHEIIPLYDRSGNVYSADDGVREDSTPEKLGRLKPYFDRLARGEAAEPPPSQAIAVGPPIRAQT